MSTWPATVRLREALHRHFGDRMKYSGRVGLTHRSTEPNEPELPGAKPSWFFAPDQIRKRAKEWGPGGVDQRFGAAWAGFAPKLDTWLKVTESRGPAAVKQVYLDTLNGHVPPDEGPHPFCWRNSRLRSTHLPAPSRMGIGLRHQAARDGRWREARMLDKTSDIAVAAESWLAEFESALATSDDAALKKLFHPDSYWRDALALSWTLQTINGRDAILQDTEGASAPARRRQASPSIPIARRRER